MVVAARLVPLSVRPHPLLGRLADEGFVLAMQRFRRRQRIGLAVLGLWNRYRRDTDAEAHARTAEGGAGIKGHAGRAGEERGKDVDRAGLPKKGAGAPRSSRRSARKHG